MKYVHTGIMFRGHPVCLQMPARATLEQVNTTIERFEAHISRLFRLEHPE